MVSNILKLTDDEKEAKNLFIKIYSAYDIPIDSGNLNDLKPDIPIWFDEQKFKRGQKYYHDNSAGILQAVINGVACLLSDPSGLDILHSTGKSSTPEQAKARYVETVLHQKTWYDCELSKDSRSWKSLNKVRRLHLLASNASNKKGVGIISQTEIAMTLFTFMGFTVARPTHFNIRYENKAECEGFIHFWAVMGHIIGLKDEFNYSLQSLEVCALVCEIFIRYVFLPYLQFEPPLFKQILNAIVNGLGTIAPDLKYDSILFMTRRSCSLIGYQYKIDFSKENIIKDIFTKDEINTLKNYIHRSPHAVKDSIRHFPERIHIIDVLKQKKNLILPNYDEEEQKFCNYINSHRQELGLQENDKFLIKTIEHENYQTQLCDTKFQNLPFLIKMSIRLKIFLFWVNDNYFGYLLNKYMVKMLESKLQISYKANFKKLSLK